MSDEQKDKAPLSAVQNFYNTGFFKNNDKNHNNGRLNKLVSQVLDVIRGASEWLLALWLLQWQLSSLFHSQE